jgi:hypothetical protein
MRRACCGVIRVAALLACSQVTARSDNAAIAHLILCISPEIPSKLLPALLTGYKFKLFDPHRASNKKAP